MSAIDSPVRVNFDLTFVWITTDDGGYSARGGALAALGNTVYVAGDESAAGQSADVMVRAYDAADGSLLWADTYDMDGYYDSAHDIDVGGGVVVVTGEGRSSAFSPDLLTRAYDAVTGAVLWTVQHDVAGSSDQSWAVEITDSLAVIVGQGYADDHEWVVRAYDLATGALAWDDVFDRSGGSDTARDVTSFGPSVFVVGSTQEAGTGYPGQHSDGNHPHLSALSGQRSSRGREHFLPRPTLSGPIQKVSPEPSSFT